MRIDVNGLKLFIDIQGTKLGIDAAGQYFEKPTLLIVHGGPGFDHSVFRPYYDRFSDIAQVVYFDLAGHGRSDLGGPDRWTLASWGRDVAGICEALEITKPIVIGVSFGGFVTMSYAIQFPDRPGALVLASTAARTDLPRKLAAFEAAGGPAARDAAEAFWTNPTDANVATYMQVCMPLYTPPGSRSDVGARAIMRLDSFYHFAGADREMMTYDFRDALGRLTCPVLVVSGGLDPITPPADLAEIVSALPAELGRLAVFPDCGHGVESTDPSGYDQLLREFIAQTDNLGPPNGGMANPS
jgi:proline iminopeptidase